MSVFGLSVSVLELSMLVPGMSRSALHEDSADDADGCANDVDDYANDVDDYANDAADCANEFERTER